MALALPVPIGTRRRRRARTGLGALGRRARRDDGFSLVEAVVALALLAVVVTITAAWVLNASQATRIAHEDAQVADLLQDDLEKVRAAPFGTLTMGSPLPADPLVATSTGMATLGVGRTDERVVSFGAPTLLPHVVDGTFNATVDGTPYRLTRYVTQPAWCTKTAGSVPSATDICHRYSAMVTWASGGRTRTRWASEVVSNADRSVAEDWSWTVPGGTSPIVGSGGRVVVPVTVLNNGNRNAWSLTATVTYGSTTAGSTRWFLDANGDGVPQSTEAADQALPGTGQTGNVESGRLVRCLAEITGLQAGRIYTVTARSTSLMEPTTPTAQPAVQDVATTLVTTS
jgi:prepilin-type N-terminal cleavage/methylation domain-containing protein